MPAAAIWSTVDETTGYVEFGEGGSFSLVAPSATPSLDHHNNELLQQTFFEDKIIEANETLTASTAELDSLEVATGPHLDWRMNWRDRRIDPELLAPPMPKP